MAISRSAQESFFDGLWKSIDDREIGADCARRFGPAELPILHPWASPDLSAYESYTWAAVTPFAKVQEEGRTIADLVPGSVNWGALRPEYRLCIG